MNNSSSSPDSTGMRAKMSLLIAAYPWSVPHTAYQTRRTIAGYYLSSTIPRQRYAWHQHTQCQYWTTGVGRWVQHTLRQYQTADSLRVADSTEFVPAFLKLRFATCFPGRRSTVCGTDTPNASAIPAHTPRVWCEIKREQLPRA
eukprot:183351-Rhodomonas_salina.4